MNPDKTPDPNTRNPIPNVDTVIHVKPTIDNPNIVVGDFTYFADRNFVKQVTHHYGFYGDKLVIGKFCQIGKGAEFVMNGANHQMACVSTFPFYIFDGWNEAAPPLHHLPSKGDTVIGNDVWMGEYAAILPGVNIGDGAIIGNRAVVGKNVPPYSIVTGNPARIIRKRFDDALITIMLKLKWWDKPVGEIQKLIPILHDNDLDGVKKRLADFI